MAIDYCSERQIAHIKGLLINTPRDMDVKPIYEYLCPVLIFVCLFSIVFNAILIGISRQNKVVNKSPILLLSLNLAVTDLLASLTNGLTILLNSYLPAVHGILAVTPCWVLILELIRGAALVASALHLLALAIVHYRGIVNPLHYRSTIFFSQHLSRSINIISIVCWIIPLTIMLVEFTTTPCQGFQTASCDYYFLMGFNFRYILLASFALPLVLMVAIYLRIFIIISRHQRSRRLTHIERGSTLTRAAVFSASAPLGSAAAAAALDLPQLMAAAGERATEKAGATDLREIGELAAEPDQQRRRQASRPEHRCSVCNGTIGLADEPSARNSAERRQQSAASLASCSDSLTGSSSAASSPSSSTGASSRAETEEDNANAANIIEFTGPKTTVASSRLLAADAAAPEISNSIQQQRQRQQNGLVRTGEQRANIDCDQLGEDERDKKGQNLLLGVCSISPATDGRNSMQSSEPAKIAATSSSNNNNIANEGQLCDQNCSSDLMSPLMGVEAAAAATPTSKPSGASSRPNSVSLAADGRAKSGQASDCCPPFSGQHEQQQQRVAAGCQPSGAHSLGETAPPSAGTGNLPRSGGRSDSCRGQRARAPLRAQFSLGAQLLVAPTSQALKLRQQQQQVRLPSKSSLKKQHSKQQQQHLSFDQKQLTVGGAAASKSNDVEAATWDWCSCDNKLRQLSFRLARANTLAGSNGSGGGGVNEKEHPTRGTLVTMSITSQVMGSSAVASETKATSNGASQSVGPRKQKLCRSMTEAAVAPAREPHSAGSTKAAPVNNLSRHFSSTSTATTNCGVSGGSGLGLGLGFGSRYGKSARTTSAATSSVAGASYYEPQRRHLHASAVPQTNTKALVTTLLILGTYFISYVPAIVFQALTCIDHEFCPMPLYSLPFSRRIFWGSVTTVLVIIKSIIDPLIYSYRSSEVQVAINHYLSKRRSKSSLATSVILQQQTSQRYQGSTAAAAGGGASIYNNKTKADKNNNHCTVDSTQHNRKAGARLLRILTLQKDDKPFASGQQLRQQRVQTRAGCQPIRTTTSSSDDSPSRKLAKRYQSFDKFDDDDDAFRNSLGVKVQQQQQQPITKNTDLREEEKAQLLIDGAEQEHRTGSSICNGTHDLPRQLRDA